MASYNAPIPSPPPPIFNSANYLISDSSLTIANGDLRYLKLSGGTLSGNLTISNSKLILDQTQSIGFYRNTGTLDLNSYIGTESGNTSNLTIYSLRGNGSVKVLANSGGTNPAFLVNSTNTTTPSATDLMRIQGNGNIGINTNSPAYKLDVNGSFNASGISIDTSANLTIANSSTSGASNSIKIGSSNIYNTTANEIFINSNGGVSNMLHLYSNYYNYSGSCLMCEASGLQIALNINKASGYASLETYNSCDLKLNASTNKIYMGSTSFYSQATTNYFGTNQAPSYPLLMNILNSAANADIRFGSDTSVNNCITVSWDYAGSGNSNNKIHFDAYGTSNILVLQCDNKVAINGSTASYNLDVFGSTSATIDVGGSGYGSLSKTATSFTIGPLASQSITARFSNGILLTSGNYFTTSDRRIKNNFEDINMKLVDNFIETSPCIWSYNTQKERNIGYIAQDLLKKELYFLINYIDNPDMKETVDEDGFVSQEGIQYSLDYSKMSCLLHLKMKELINRIEELEKK